MHDLESQLQRRVSAAKDASEKAKNAHETAIAAVQEAESRTYHRSINDALDAAREAALSAGESFTRVFRDYKETDERADTQLLLASHAVKVARSCVRSFLALEKTIELQQGLIPDSILREPDALDSESNPIEPKIALEEGIYEGFEEGADLEAWRGQRLAETREFDSFEDWQIPLPVEALRSKSLRIIDSEGRELGALDLLELVREYPQEDRD